jgi:hypothetical protein
MEMAGDAGGTVAGVGRHRRAFRFAAFVCASFRNRVFAFAACVCSVEVDTGAGIDTDTGGVRVQIGVAAFTISSTRARNSPPSSRDLRQ